MLRRLILTFMTVASISLNAGNQYLLERLDSTLESREQYSKAKMEKIEFLKKQARTEPDAHSLLNIYNKIYDEYYVFKFDSAKIYVDKGLQLAYYTKDQYYINLNIILKSQLLAIGGLYSEAIANISTIDIRTLDKRLLFKYYSAYSKLYFYWADYCNDSSYAPKYRTQATAYLRKAIANLSHNDNEYDYYMGEYYIYVERDDRKALKHYFQTLKKSPVDSRAYAMASFAIANNYSAHHDKNRYEEYLIRACISDVICCTKENLALQDLAMFLFEQDYDNIERAEQYINISMNDAKEYNNRLRILEISQKLPAIVSSYQTMVKERNKYQRLALIFVSLLFIGLFIASYFIIRQNNLLTLRRKELSKSNNMLTSLNEQLSQLNGQLIDTNRKREGLAKLYIDLCAKYIDRLSRYQTLVKRKIKANQVNELLSTMSSSRLSEEDAATFMNRFDKAFLDLYPSFVTEINRLLRPEYQLEITHTHTMNTEIRIFALIRLGVKESAEIAGLLFYSPQTIYNYRSAVKAKAINRDTFEEDVQRLCITNA